MNRLRGVINSIEFNDHISLVELKTEVGHISLLLLETPAKVSYLQTGKQVNVIFNPTAVRIAKHRPADMLVENIIQCEVSNIKEGKIISAITLRSGKVEITSYTTTKLLNKIGLRPGEVVFAVVSPTDIMVEV